MAHLRDFAYRTATDAWQESWPNTLRRGPVYRAFHHPTGKPHDFITPRAVFCPAIRLLTEYAFTGEFSARHRPPPTHTHANAAPPSFKLPQFKTTGAPTGGTRVVHTGTKPFTSPSLQLSILNTHMLSLCVYCQKKKSI
jgi:hypothetical protein